MHSSKHNNWYLAGSVSLVFFMILGYTVKFYESTLSFIDQPLTTAIRGTLTEAKTAFFTGITQLGSSIGLAILLLITCLFLFKFKRKAEALWLLINVGLIASLGNYLIKFLFQRPRPSVDHLVYASHYSFPSGHSMASILFYGTLIIISQFLIKNKTYRFISQFILGCLILLIGMSRVYLGVHYPTDIIGGYLLGLSWLLVTYPLFQKQRFIWRFKGKQK